MKSDFGGLFRELDKLLGKTADEIQPLYKFAARSVLHTPGKHYKVPGLIIEMFEPRPEGVRELPDDIGFQVIIHNHPVGPCSTPRFCFEYGFDPNVLPLRVRKNFMAINHAYFKAPVKEPVVKIDLQIDFEF